MTRIAAWAVNVLLICMLAAAGRIKSTVKLAEAQRRIALIQYEKAIQTAFTEVSDALIAHQRVRESREKQEELLVALRDRTRLAYIRYRGGVDTQLNALDADRDLFQAELTLSGIRLTSCSRWWNCTRPWAAAGSNLPAISDLRSLTTLQSSNEEKSVSNRDLGRREPLRRR